MESDVILWGDSLEVLKSFPDESVDSVVTDPPYGLGNHEPTPEEIIAFLQGGGLNTGGDFMGKDWDLPPVELWTQCYRVLKPGGYLLSLAGTRTWDLMSMGIRMAGFTDRDTIASIYGGVLIWLRGQGFPKNHDVSKAIDKAAGAEREVIGKHSSPASTTRIDTMGRPHASGSGWQEVPDVTAPATAEAEMWDGWGTALRPLWEPILVFRKPLEGTVAENVLKHGTGALNIGGCRVGSGEILKGGGGRLWSHERDGTEDRAKARVNEGEGRWPPNVTFTHLPECKLVGTKKVKAPTINRFDDGMKPFGDGAGHSFKSTEGGEIEEAVYECADGCPVKALDEQSGMLTSGSGAVVKATAKGYQWNTYKERTTPVGTPQVSHDDSGGASRFFPQFEGQEIPDAPFMYTAKVSPSESTMGGQLENKHPTRKPIALMRWLVKLVTRPGGLVLDPYCGSGTTCAAAVELGMQYVGIERDPVYHDTATKRLAIVEGVERDKQHARNIFDMINDLDCDPDL